MSAKRLASPPSKRDKASDRLAAGLERPELYLNRELSLLEFNRRVLEEARDTRHPLLERVKFLAIFASAMDDFYALRIAPLKQKQLPPGGDPAPDAMTSIEQLEAIHRHVGPLLTEQRQVVTEQLIPALAEAGIDLLNYDQLDTAQRQAVSAYFHREIFPIVTPLAVDPGHPFPHISNLSLNLAVLLRTPLGRERFARIKIPPTLPRLVRVPVSVHRPPPSLASPSVSEAAPASVPSPMPEAERVAFIWLEQAVAAHLDILFRGMEIVHAYPFRVLRDADIAIREDEESRVDLLEEVRHGLRERRFGAPVQLCVDVSMPAQVVEMLLDHLELGQEDALVFDGPLGLSDLMELLRLDRPDLKDQPLLPQIAPELATGRDPFAAIVQGDLLLHHPYDSFSTVADFIYAAARDPHVLAIKQTLYRVGTDSPVVLALLEAIERGKQVAVLVEVKARFDEENNIEWARALEEAGVHVTYGLVGLKTHAKVALVVRRERDGLQRYVHLGTGNYNASTARTYEDFCLLTSDPDLGADASELFNVLTGYSRQSEYRKLLVAPLSLRRELLARIDRVIARHRAGSPGRLIFKVNALVDAEMIRALYRASRAGVQVDLIVRGICCLRPGISRVSDTIRVVSLVGRFLEHSRIFYFVNGSGQQRQEELYLGSADLMPRNLDRRVEVLFPIGQSHLRAALREQVLEQLLQDTVNARTLHSNGSYSRRRPAEDQAPLDMHLWFAANRLVRAE